MSDTTSNHAPYSASQQPKSDKNYCLGNRAVALPAGAIISGYVLAAFQYTGYMNYVSTQCAPANAAALLAWHLSAEYLESNFHEKKVLPVLPMDRFENTICVDVQGEIMLRAWMDTLRIEHNLDDSVEAAEHLSVLMCGALRAVRAPYGVVRAIEVYVLGKAHYFKMTGETLQDVNGFVEHALKFGLKHVLADVGYGKRYYTRFDTAVF